MFKSNSLYLHTTKQQQLSKLALILGEAGSGKSTAIRTLNPKETFIINSLGKDLPFRGSSKLYTYYHKDTNPTGNMLNSSQGTVVLQWLNYIDQKMPHIKNIVIDDNTHQSSMEYIRRIRETNWEKWNDIAFNMVTIADTCKKLRDNLTVFILHHVTTEGDGILETKKVKAQTLGKLVDQKLSSYEAFFTIVLLAQKVKKDDKIEHFFLTRDADSTAKSPMGMFEDEQIPNDLQLVRDTIDGYYNDDAEVLTTKTEKTV